MQSGFEVQVPFNREATALEPILLGRAKFFEEFEVTFKETEKTVVLKPVGSSVTK